MTDGERARLKDTKSLFDQASGKVMNNSIEMVFYTTISMTLGWVLDEKVYRENFEEHIRRLKSMGVEPAKSVIEKPNTN